MSSEKLIFGKGIVLKSGSYYFDVVLASREEEDIQNTMILMFENGDWNFWEIDKRIVDFVVTASDSDSVFQGVAEDGFCNTDPMGQVWRHIDISKGGPNHLKYMTAICLLEGYYYAVGMSRMVYRKRLDDTSWARFDNGINTPSKSEEITGFMSIDGVSSNEIYAVGYEGDIWWCDKGIWKEVESPTNVVLNSVKSCKDGYVYICGNEGVVLKGRRESWEAIENSVTEDDLWSIEEYKEKIYFSANMMPLYRIENDSLQEVSAGPADTTSGSLNAKNGELLSVGEHDIFLFDGFDWSEIVVPPYS